MAIPHGKFSKNMIYAIIIISVRFRMPKYIVFYNTTSQVALYLTYAGYTSSSKRRDMACACIKFWGEKRRNVILSFLLLAILQLLPFWKQSNENLEGIRVPKGMSFSTHTDNGYLASEPGRIQPHPALNSTAACQNRRYLVYLAGGGLNNQILRFRTALAHAIHLKRDLVLDDVHVATEHSIDGRFYTFPFEHYFEIPSISGMEILTFARYTNHLMACGGWQQIGEIPVVSSAPERYHPGIPKHLQVHLPENRRQNLNSSHCHTILFHNIVQFNLGVLFAPNEALRMVGLLNTFPMTSNRISSVADKFIAEILLGVDFVALHLRRGDFKEYCEKECLIKANLSCEDFRRRPCPHILRTLVAPDSMINIVDIDIVCRTPNMFNLCMDWCYPVYDVLLLEIQRSIPRGAKMFIITNGDQEEVKLALQRTFDVYFAPVQNDTLDSVLLDMEIARRAARFIGNGFSTMSMNIGVARGPSKPSTSLGCVIA